MEWLNLKLLQRLSLITSVICVILGFFMGNDILLIGWSFTGIYITVNYLRNNYKSDTKSKLTAAFHSTLIFFPLFLLIIK